jgi:DNA-binding transcriptional LysR family regulator
VTAHPLGITRRVAIAAPAYLARCGEPQTPQALRDHNCIVYTGITAPHLWSFECDGREQTVHVRGNLHCNSSEAVREAVLAGLGIALSPT